MGAANASVRAVFWAALAICLTGIKKITALGSTIGDYFTSNNEPIPLKGRLLYGRWLLQQPTVFFAF